MSNLTPEQSAIRSLENAIYAIVDSLGGKKPEKLVHYTSADAFMNIIKEGKLRATDSRYLNDESEQEHFFSLLDGAITKHVASAKSSQEREALELISSLSRSIEVRKRTFITCFCKKENLLSQWRAYGGYKAPISLEFDMNSLYDHHFNTRDLIPVIYKDTIKSVHIESFLDCSIRYIKEYMDLGYDPAQSGGIYDITYAMNFLSTCMKHESFEEEQEFRIIRTIDERNPAKICFRDSQFAVTPFIELEITVNGLLPLNKVCIGPNSYPALAKASVEEFLASKKYGISCLEKI